MLYTTHSHSPARWRVSYKRVCCVVCRTCHETVYIVSWKEIGRKESSWSLNLTPYTWQGKKWEKSYACLSIALGSFSVWNKFHCFILLYYFPDPFTLSSEYFKTTCCRDQRFGKGYFSNPLEAILWFLADFAQYQCGFTYFQINLESSI